MHVKSIGKHKKLYLFFSLCTIMLVMQVAILISAQVRRNSILSTLPYISQGQFDIADLMAHLKREAVILISTKNEIKWRYRFPARGIMAYATLVDDSVADLNIAIGEQRVEWHEVNISWYDYLIGNLIIAIMVVLPYSISCAFLLNAFYHRFKGSDMVYSSIFLIFAISFMIVIWMKLGMI